MEKTAVMEVKPSLTLLWDFVVKIVKEKDILRRLIQRIAQVLRLIFHNPLSMRLRLSFECRSLFSVSCDLQLHTGDKDSSPKTQRAYTALDVRDEASVMSQRRPISPAGADGAGSRGPVIGAIMNDLQEDCRIDSAANPLDVQPTTSQATQNPIEHSPLFESNAEFNAAVDDAKPQDSISEPPATPRPLVIEENASLPVPLPPNSLLRLPPPPPPPPPAPASWSLQMIAVTEKPASTGLAKGQFGNASEEALQPNRSALLDSIRQGKLLRNVKSEAKLDGTAAGSTTSAAARSKQTEASNNPKDIVTSSAKKNSLTSPIVETTVFKELTNRLQRRRRHMDTRRLSFDTSPVKPKEDVSAAKPEGDVVASDRAEGLLPSEEETTTLGAGTGSKDSNENDATAAEEPKDLIGIQRSRTSMSKKRRQSASWKIPVSSYDASAVVTDN
eukprot:ANDGO_02074.mRNA.1 hypothetical protein